MACRLGAHDDDQPPGRGRSQPAGRRAFPEQRRRPHRQCRQPRRLSRRFARSTGIMPRPRPAMIGMTRTIARGYAAEGILAFAVAPGFTVSEMTEEYLAGPRRRADRRRYPARPGREHRRNRRDHPLARDRCAGLRDRLDHRRQWRQLCSLGSRSSRSWRPRPRRQAQLLELPLDVVYALYFVSVGLLRAGVEEVAPAPGPQSPGARGSRT